MNEQETGRGRGDEQTKQPVDVLPAVVGTSLQSIDAQAHPQPHADRGGG